MPFIYEHVVYVLRHAVGERVSRQARPASFGTGFLFTLKHVRATKSERGRDGDEEEEEVKENDDAHLSRSVGVS